MKTRQKKRESEGYKDRQGREEQRKISEIKKGRKDRLEGKPDKGCQSTEMESSMVEGGIRSLRQELSCFLLAPCYCGT